jgi:cytochrome c oxidase subunit 2
MFTLFIVACLVGVGVLFTDVNEKAKERAAAEQEAKTPSLKVTATNFQFDKPVYTVKKGETLKVTFTNGEGVHALEIVGYNVHLDQQNPSQEVTFDKAGEFEMHCVLMCGAGHANMKSKLVVQ